MLLIKPKARRNIRFVNPAQVRPYTLYLNQFIALEQRVVSFVYNKKKILRIPEIALHTQSPRVKSCLRSPNQNMSEHMHTAYLSSTDKTPWNLFGLIGTFSKLKCLIQSALLTVPKSKISVISHPTYHPDTCCNSYWQYTTQSRTRTDFPPDTEVIVLGTMLNLQSSLPI